jgi:hypothetical protein
MQKLIYKDYYRLLARLNQKMAQYPDIAFFQIVTAQGRVTIPDSIRKQYKIKAGDSVYLKLEQIKHKEP